MIGTKRIAMLATVGLLASASAQATLFDRGAGLLYDDVLNVTWLQDANYARTSHYSADGLMTWNDAQAWAANLSYFDSVRNVTYTDWRLPSVAPLDPHGFNGAFQSPAGTTDYGFNITRPTNELSYMYYVNLGLKGFYSTLSTDQYYVLEPNYGVFGDGTIGGEADVGLVRDLQSSIYWYGTESDPRNPGTPVAFLMFYGGMAAYSSNSLLFAWAVRDGDVAAAAAVPEPVSMALVGVGLGGLALVRRRRPSASA